MNTVLLGFLTTVIIYSGIVLLHSILPSRNVKGYVTHHKTGEKLHYRLNGLFILLLSIAAWWLLGYFKVVPYDWLYTVRFYSFGGAFSIGILFSLFIVLPFPSTGKNLLADLFFGRLENPQFKKGRIDAKMILYLIGAVMLELNVLSFTAYHYMTFKENSSLGVFIYTALISYFVLDYLTFEKVHLYTYDFFAERVGFKLGWGCLTFYPFFYSIGLFVHADWPSPQTPVWLNIHYIGIFFTGWICARGANMQKYFFKTNPEKKFLWMKPESISDGKNTLLVSGFWGVSRHINYMGEILMACGITLSLGYPGSILPWLYPLYYVALLVPRQISDDKRCSLKYGALWQEYEKKVKYRIIPFLY